MPSILSAARAVRAVRALAVLSLLLLLAGAVAPPRALAQAPEAPVTTIVPAPIDRVEIVADATAPGRYAAVVTSGLPGGCASFDSISARRAGTRIDVTVRNVLAIPAGGAYTAIYGIVEHTVDLGGDFEAGTVYTVAVNDGDLAGMTETFSPDSTPPVAPVTPLPANTGNGGPAAPAPSGELDGAARTGIASIAAAALLLPLILVRVRRGA